MFNGSLVTESQMLGLLVAKTGTKTPINSLSHHANV